MVLDSKTTKFVSQILHAVLANAGVSTYYIVLFRHFTKHASLWCKSLLYLWLFAVTQEAEEEKSTFLSCLCQEAD